jgi:hypothetical protein
MVDLRIPKEYERGFVEIRELEESQILELLTALESEPATLNRADLQSQVASKVETILSDEIDVIMETLVSLYALRDSMGLQTSEFADVVSDAVEASNVEELELADEEEREHFKTRLVRLLGVFSLDVAAKATDLLYEHEHTVHGLPRVLSDVRPIFGADPEDPPTGAVVVHTLKISYHEDRQIKEFFIALDSYQVDELIGVLGRASLKGESLKRMLTAAGVPHIDAG